MKDRVSFVCSLSQVFIIQEPSVKLNSNTFTQVSPDLKASTTKEISATV